MKNLTYFNIKKHLNYIVMITNKTVLREFLRNKLSLVDLLAVLLL